jgi:hypothetical protein
VHARTKLFFAAAVTGAGAALWQRRNRAARWHTGDVLPSLEFPVPTVEPVVVPDPAADLATLAHADAPNRPHLTLLGDLPLDDPHPSVDADLLDPAPGATVTNIAGRSDHTT